MIYQEGNYYHVYNRGCNKNKIFFQDSDYKILLSKMNKTKEIKDIEIIAYCLMPNHYHFLLFQKSEIPISDWLKSLFSGYVQKINRKYKRSGTLFERSANPKLVTNNNYLIELIHYIHANPVKHNFVAHPIEWKYASLKWYLNNFTDSLINKKVLLEYFSAGYDYKDSFAEYLEKKEYENFKP